MGIVMSREEYQVWLGESSWPGTIRVYNDGRREIFTRSGWVDLPPVEDSGGRWALGLPPPRAPHSSELQRKPTSTVLRIADQVGTVFDALPLPEALSGPMRDAFRAHLAAAAEGRRLGLDQRARHGGDPSRLATALGLRVQRISRSQLAAHAATDGLGLLDETERTVYVAIPQTAEEESLTVAHECGHALMGYVRRGAGIQRIQGWHHADEVKAEAFGLAFLGRYP